jgi:tryptophan-rich sensory protein
MGYASYLVWKQGGLEAQKRPLTFYGLQLAFNLAWPVTFFLRKKLGQGQIVNLSKLQLLCASGCWAGHHVLSVVIACAGVSQSQLLASTLPWCPRLLSVFVAQFVLRLHVSSADTYCWT